MKPKNTPVQIKSYSFDEMIKKHIQKNEEAINYVKTTGKCCSCKKNKVAIGTLHCQKCLDETEKLLTQLRGPGFMELKIPIR